MGNRRNKLYGQFKLIDSRQNHCQGKSYEHTASWINCRHNILLNYWNRNCPGCDFYSIIPTSSTWQRYVCFVVLFFFLVDAPQPTTNTYDIESVEGSRTCTRDTRYAWWWLFKVHAHIRNIAKMWKLYGEAFFSKLFIVLNSIRIKVMKKTVRSKRSPQPIFASCAPFFDRACGFRANSYVGKLIFSSQAGCHASIGLAPGSVPTLELDNGVRVDGGLQVSKGRVGYIVPDTSPTCFEGFQWIEKGWLLHGQIVRGFTGRRPRWLGTWSACLVCRINSVGSRLPECILVDIISCL